MDGREIGGWGAMFTKRMDMTTVAIASSHVICANRCLDNQAKLYLVAE